MEFIGSIVHTATHGTPGGLPDEKCCLAEYIFFVFNLAQILIPGGGGDKLYFQMKGDSPGPSPVLRRISRILVEASMNEEQSGRGDFPCCMARRL